jgi:hypothetical protein
MIKNKIKILIVFVKSILRLAYLFFKGIAGFLGCSIYRFNISRFTDLKFFKKIIRDSLSRENKTKPKITPTKKPGNYDNLAYEIIIMNFDKLGFSGSALINSKHREFIKDNLSLSEKERIISEADQVCAHKFDLLGSGRVKVDHFLKAAGVEGFVYDNRLGNDEIRELIEKTRGQIRGILEIPANKEVPLSSKISEIQETLQAMDSPKPSESSQLADTPEELQNQLDFSNSYDPIDWHVDFKSGYRWDSNTWYKKIKYGHVPGVDIKIPWELSRSSHFITLGQAYWITSDEKYSKEYICQITDWVTNNPVSSGVNWVCTMDVAIRACNWILSLSFFAGSSLINKEFINKISKSLYLHGFHIEKNLERGFLRVKGNHYVSDILGLLYIGLFFRFTKFGDRWLKFAIKELKNEINSQVYEDGTDFEASTYYHRLKTELFFYAMFFTIRCSEKFNGSNYIELGNEIFGAGYVLKAKKMFEAIINLVDLNGNLAQTGDNDNGKLHIFSASEIKNMQYMITLPEIFYGGPSPLLGDAASPKTLESLEHLKQPINSVLATGVSEDFKPLKPLEPAGLPGNMKIKEFDFNSSALWLFGKYGMDTWNLLNEKSIKNLNSASFKNSGWYLCKCNNKESGLFFSLNITCGPNGLCNKGGHAHNDKLSFSLDINEDKIFVDPGTYLYTPLESLRNEFRSVLSHNTVTVDNSQQNRFVPNNSFILVDDAKAKVKKSYDNDKYYFFSGEHYGYGRLSDPVIHERQIIVNKEDMSIFIRDILKNSGCSHEYFFNFTLAPELDFKINDKNNGIDFFLSDGNSFCFSPVTKSDMDFNVPETFYSDSYGNKTKTSKLSYFTRSEEAFEVYFAISRTDKEYTFSDLSELFNAAD